MPTCNSCSCETNILYACMHTISMFPSSQPVPSRDEGVPSDSTDEAVAVESFTQPSRYDEMVMGTQVPCTPGASQVSVCVRVCVCVCEVHSQMHV